MTSTKPAGPRPHGAVRAAVIAASLTVAACFSAAVSFAQTSVDAPDAVEG